MKRFQFKLQAVLALRRRAEQEALAHYAQAIQTGRAAQEKLGEAEAHLCDARRGWLNAMADGLPAARAAQMRAHNDWLEERKKRCEHALRLAEAELEQASRRMVLARQQREAVEKHLANQREQYDHALAHEECKMIDDLVQTKTKTECGEEGTWAGGNDFAHTPTFPLSHLRPLSQEPTNH